MRERPSIRRLPSVRVAFVGLLVGATVVAPVYGWGAHGHRLITYLALDTLPQNMPAWLREPGVRAQIAYQSNEPDRWRGTSTPPLGHENKPDHYLDVEDLAPYGLALETLPPWRYDYVRVMAIARYVHPEKVEPYDPAKDADRSREWPGFLPHAMAEHYAKLVAAFKSLRTLEKLNEPARAAELAMARSNVIYHMGMLSHFVGDAAQPLHTTRHHNGWADAENPNGYTKEKSFHAYVDDGVIREHKLSYEFMRERAAAARQVDGKAPWADLIAHVKRGFEQVEPLYKLEKSGDLKREAGRDFIAGRLADGASMLAGLYAAAWKASEPSAKDVEDFVRYGDRPGGIPVAEGGG